MDGLASAIAAAAALPHRTEEVAWRVEAARAAAKVCFSLEAFVEGEMAVYEGLAAEM